MKRLALFALAAGLAVATLARAQEAGVMPGQTMDPSMPGTNSPRAQLAPVAPQPAAGAQQMAGMEMTGESVQGGMDMRPVDVAGAPAAAPDARGNQLLEPTLAPDGAKEFQLSAGVVRWSILPDVQVGAYAYNGQVPGPQIRVTQGDRLRIRFTNNLPEPSSIHWHGLVLDNGMDGAADVTQPPVEPGQSFTYEFTAEQAGTYFYHSHKAVDRQQTLGLYGTLIVEPREWAAQKPFDREYTIALGEWTVDGQGRTLPAMNQPGLFPNFFTINGKSYPATETVTARVGERIRFRFVGSGQAIHPMHIHGGSFEIVETDGNPVPPGARLLKDTVLVGPGERYDVEWVAQRRGKWLLHCHINDHVTNNGAEVEGGGGLTMVIDVKDDAGRSAASLSAAQAATSSASQPARPDGSQSDRPGMVGMAEEAGQP